VLWHDVLQACNHRRLCLQHKNKDKKEELTVKYFFASRLFDSAKSVSSCFPHIQISIDFLFSGAQARSSLLLSF